jgi:hypothetical protein
MRSRRAFRLFLLLVLLAPAQIAMQAETGWESVTPGVEFQEFTLADPNRVFVARMDRRESTLTLDTTIAKGVFRQGTETVSDMVARYDQTISSWGGQWGMRNHVVVAINGSFHDINTGMPETGMIQSGWYAKRFDDLGGSSGFAWTRDRSAFIGGCAFHRPEQQRVILLDAGITLPIDAINFRERDSQLTLYTYQRGATTPARHESVELQIELTEPAGVVPPPRSVLGYIRQISPQGGGTLIPYDHVVISASGDEGEALLKGARLGGRVGLTAEISNLEPDCGDPAPNDWSLAFASLGGSFHFLKDGEIQTFEDPGATSRQPRTAICFNDRYIYFLVVDGRQGGYSIGMSMDDLGAFCRDTLESDEGVNQDGGGSSTFWMDGEVLNRPSDGQERPVANGWLIVQLEPLERSEAFLPGEPVTVTELADLRLGPGRLYRSYADVQEGDSGMILHPLNGLEGVLAQGEYWWKVAVGDREGWVTEDALASDPDWQALWRWHP